MERLRDEVEVGISKVVQIDTVDLCTKVDVACHGVLDGHNSPSSAVGMWKDTFFCRCCEAKGRRILCDSGSNNHGEIPAARFGICLRIWSLLKVSWTLVSGVEQLLTTGSAGTSLLVLQLRLH